MPVAVSFGPFRFHPARHLLFSGDAPIRTSRRALEVLAVLIERPGELVSKRELMHRVWQDDAVQDSNLKVQMTKLRKALGDDVERGSQYIATVNGRGYRFIAAIDARITLAGPQKESLEAPSSMPFASPAPPGRLIGRGPAVGAVQALLARRPLVTIAGPGGIGKTAVALAVADRMRTKHGFAVRFVDLGNDDAYGAIDTLASILAAQAQPDRQPGRMLLVLDSCEHLDEAAVTRLDRITGTVPGTLVLATSRAPLCTSGEALYRLAPLACPAPGEAPTAAQAMHFPAIELFVERAGECLDGYRLHDVDVPAVTDICTRLEGHPLAIGMAAHRMDAFSASQIATRLEHSPGLLRARRHAGPPRHASLAASVEWSVQALPARERTILRGLAMLPGPFTLDGATALFAGKGLDAHAVVDGVSALVTKSLLVAAMDGDDMHYRLPATIKPYVQA